MKLVFYYHTILHNANGKFYVPSYLGTFIDALARNAQELILVLHTSDKRNFNQDYLLHSQNITLVDLGQKHNSVRRLFFERKLVRECLKGVFFDAILVRAPSPLAPHFQKCFPNKTAYLLVGDYVESGKMLKANLVKKQILRLFLQTYQIMQNRAVSNSMTFVNSKILYDKNVKIAKNIELIKTTTLEKKDFYMRIDTCDRDTVNLLYTGRLDWAKGIKEMLEVVKEFSCSSYNIILHIVGWDDDPSLKTENGIKKMIRQLGIDSYVVLYGKMSIGDELNKMYRLADIYLMPSYAEGFPRAIWEAMANGVPVIATCVGSIPHFLRDGQDALLIQPKSTKGLSNAIIRIIKDSQLRQKLIENGYLLVQDNTLEIHVEKLMQTLKKYVD